MSSASRRVEAAQRIERALELHLTGCTWPQVARQAGYSTAANACKAVTRYLRSHPTQSVEELRETENLKLLPIERGLWEIIRATHWATCSKGLVETEDGERVEDRTPKIQAYRALIQVYTRRARLLGLDALIRIAISDEEIHDPEIEQLMREIDRTLSSRPRPDVPIPDGMRAVEVNKNGYPTRLEPLPGHMLTDGRYVPERE